MAPSAFAVRSGPHRTRTRSLKGNIPWPSPTLAKARFTAGPCSQGAALGTNGKHRLALAKARGFLLYLSLVLKHHYDNNTTAKQRCSRGTVVASVHINLHGHRHSTSNCPAIPVNTAMQQLCTTSVPHGSSSHGRITSKVETCKLPTHLKPSWCNHTLPSAYSFLISVSESKLDDASSHAIMPLMPPVPIQLRSRHCVSLRPGECDSKQDSSSPCHRDPSLQVPAVEPL